MMTWSDAFSLIGTLVVVFGFLIQVIATRASWKRKLLQLQKDLEQQIEEVQDEHSKEITSLKEKLASAERNIDELQRREEEQEESFEKHIYDNKNDFNRNEDKIEKLTDIMIDYIQNDKR